MTALGAERLRRLRVLGNIDVVGRYRKANGHFDRDSFAKTRGSGAMKDTWLRPQEQRQQ